MSTANALEPIHGGRAISKPLLTVNQYLGQSHILEEWYPGMSTLKISSDLALDTEGPCKFGLGGLIVSLSSFNSITLVATFNRFHSILAHRLEKVKKSTVGSFQSPRLGIYTAKLTMSIAG